MQSKEDYILVQLLGPDTPQVRALVAAAAANPQMQGAVHEMLRSMVRQRGWNPDNLPAFVLPHGLPPSDFILGTARSGDVSGPEVGLAESELPQHVGVFGQTASGKTSLILIFLLSILAVGRLLLKRRYTCLVWDAHSEYRVLLPLMPPGEMVWLTPATLGLNPLEIPRGMDGKRVMSPDSWVSGLREWIRALYLNEPSLNLFSEQLREEYRRRGVYDGRDDYPSLSDLIEVLQQLRARDGSDRARARDKVIDRLDSVRTLLPGLNVQRSRDFARLMGRSVILDVAETKDVALPLLFAFLVMLMQVVFRSDDPQPISRIWVIEEAHACLGGQLEKRTADLKEDTPSSVLRSLRKTGTCGILASQLCSDLSRSVIGNTGSVICFRQSERQSVRQAASALNLAPWQESEIAKLPPRHAIARFSRHGEPVYMVAKDVAETPLARARPVSREEARALSRAVLDSIPYVKKVEPAPAEVRGTAGPAGDASTSNGARAGASGGSRDSAASGGGGLHPGELRVFTRLVAHPAELIESRMGALSLDRETEGSARAGLEARGLLQFAGKVGAKHRLFELTARGRELAKAMGLTVAGTGKGEVVHEVIVQYAQQSLGRCSAAFKFRRAGVSPTTAGVQPDLLLILPDGRRAPLQASSLNQPAYEGDALLRLHRLAELGPGDADRVDRVIAVAVNKRHKAAIERAVKRQNGGRLPGRLRLLDFDEMMDPQFDWGEVLEWSKESPT